ncbi:GntR family transcriptional regulator [Caballeronia fortuita]|uniref:GntR family transcriptional regulator n=1 Tax=Caballeronia fortuita TaxID=1777138 RepID=A0A158D2I7_9BURK|nr:GntR family transcriptional regulator [Caballeronia fortuita]SAK88713.1 GntR family transcriptional regulator [Caballeronia fortuita]
MHTHKPAVARPHSLVAKTLDGLIEIVIATGAGGRIPTQDEISKRFRVSRTVLREALSKLELLNVITVRPKTGTTVNASAEWHTVNADVVSWRVRAGEKSEDVINGTVSLARELVMQHRAPVAEAVVASFRAKSRQA